MARWHQLWPVATAASTFDRTFDELFEELLISPWQRHARPDRAAVERAVVVDLGTRYEVRIPATRTEAESSEVEVGEHRLCVRMRSPAEVNESIFDFAHAIEIESVRARFVGGALQIVLPKKRSRKIEVG